MSKCHHFPRKLTRITHSSSRPGIRPIVSHVRRKITRLEADILQGELKKIKPPNFNGENMNGEEVKA
jgi:hypothetical protein